MTDSDDGKGSPLLRVVPTSHHDFLFSDRHRRLYPDPFVYIPDPKIPHFLALLREGRDADDIQAALELPYRGDVLCDAARRCTTEDMREAAEVADALEWFESRMVRQAAPRNFRKALDLPDPTQRYFALRDALALLARHAGLRISEV